MAHEVEKSCRNGVRKQNFCFGSGEGAIWPQSGTRARCIAGQSYPGFYQQTIPEQ